MAYVRRLLRLKALEIAILMSLSFPAYGKDQCGRELSGAIRIQPGTQPGHRGDIAGDLSVVALPDPETGLKLIVYSRKLNQVLGRGFFLTTDGGSSWSELPSPQPASTLFWGVNIVRAKWDKNTIYKYDEKLRSYLRSRNEGKTWQRILSKIVDRSDLDFAQWLAKGYSIEYRMVGISPRKPDTIFATLHLRSTKEYSAFVPMGLYRSVDGGDTWSRLVSRLEDQVPIGISDSNSDVMYGLGVNGKLMRSVDGGTSWAATSDLPLIKVIANVSIGELGKPLRLDMLYITQIVVDGQDQNVVYLLSRIGVMRSVDGGVSWRLLDLGFDELDSLNSLAESSGPRPQVIVGSTRGLFISSDSGCTFSHVYP
jgi:photosystem II stability/assembly factor-like uncharacterized protein